MLQYCEIAYSAPLRNNLHKFSAMDESLKIWNKSVMQIWTIENFFELVRIMAMVRLQRSKQWHFELKQLKDIWSNRF